MLRVRVPASSANLGPGFDALGMAVGLYLEVTASPSAVDAFTYRGAGPAPAPEGNLIHRGYRAVYQQLDEDVPPVALSVSNPIPLARGLGSSSTALVAGAALADAQLGERLGRDGVYRLAVRLEGHPDNVAPAVYGGFTVSASDQDGQYRATSLPLPQRWRLLFGVPSFELTTAAARSVLPESYAPQDVVKTSSRTALWVAAVAQDRPELLRVASLDVVHQPFRAPLVPGLPEVLAATREAGAYASFLSGSGPTVGIVASDEVLGACREAVRAYVGASGQVLEPATATGYVVERC